MRISMKTPGGPAATVPDNLDLSWHAKLAINGLMGTLDPNVNHEPYSRAFFQARPAYFFHEGMPSAIQPKYLEALALMKCMTGATDIQHEEGFIQSILGNLGEDGLLYDRALPARLWNKWSENQANVAGNGRLANAFWYWWQLTGDDTWKRAMQRCAERLCGIAVRANDVAFYPETWFVKNASPDNVAWPHTNEPAGSQEGNQGWTLFNQCQPIRGLMKWHQESGDERMLELSQRLAVLATQAKFYGANNEDDPVIGAEKAHTWGQLHFSLAAFRGLLDYAAVAGDARVLEFVNNGYQWIRHRMAPQLGTSHGIESSCLGDWTALAIALSDAGMGDYWDDADHAIRNAATQAQCLDPAALLNMGRHFPERPKDSRWGPHEDWRFSWPVANPIPAGQEDVDDVVARSVGAMCSGLRSGTWQAPSLVAAGTANGVQAFYYGWEAAIRHSNGASTVNLLYTRFSPWMDLISHLPYEGKVVIRNKATKTLGVRIPGWVRLRDVRVRINNLNVESSLLNVGRYLTLAGLSGNEVIEVTFPQPRHSLKINIPDYNYRPTSFWRSAVDVNMVGSTVIGFKETNEESSVGAVPTTIKLFDHPGYYKHLRAGTFAEKQVAAHAPERIIKWY